MTALFYVRHALAHMARERQRTLFTLFCIAAGVAAVVSLRTLGLTIEDALSRDLVAANRGDVALTMPATLEGADAGLFEQQGSVLGAAGVTLSAAGLARLEAWAAERGYELLPAWINQALALRLHKAGDETRAEFANAYFVDPARYPFYGTIAAVSPPGATLRQVLVGPRDVAVSEYVADSLDLQPGDRVSIAGASGIFTVTAIVSAKSEARLTDPLSAVFPLVYGSYQVSREAFHQLPNTCYLKLPPGIDSTAVKADVEATFPGLVATTPNDLRQVTATIGTTVTRLATAMGLISLLIGGIGIANTMVVVVSRRSLEIAVLKTVGAQARQVAGLFVIEALCLGCVGSLAGLPLGLGLVWMLRRLAERFVVQSLPFAVYGEPLAMGLVMGVFVTLAFSLLPILAAARVRPAAVLRPEQPGVPAAGKLVSLVVLVALLAVMGAIAGQILGSLAAGLAAVYGGAALLGLALLGLRGLVWGLCHLPSFGSVSLKLAQRGLGAHKGRAASTLLALMSGIMTLSVLWLLTQGTMEQVVGTAESFLGGNVLIAGQTVEAGENLETRLADLPGVLDYQHDTIYRAELVAINGNRDMDALAAQAVAAGSRGSAIGRPQDAIDELRRRFLLKVKEQDGLAYQIAEGSDLASGSVEQVLIETPAYNAVFDWFDLGPGDTLTWRFPSGAERTARLVGRTAPRQAGVVLSGMVALRAGHGIVPLGLIPNGEEPIPSLHVLRVDPARMNETLDAVAGLPGLTIVETSLFSTFVQRFADQFMSLPLLVAALALFASTVIIANTVSLATLERRREIGIMKALGLPAGRVLGLLLLENGLVGLAGGLLGTLLAAVLIAATASLGEGLGRLPLGALAALVGLAVALTLAATAATAYRASRSRPLNVLRYE